jgi:hypothetical protein
MQIGMIAVIDVAEKVPIEERSEKIRSSNRNTKAHTSRAEVSHMTNKLPTSPSTHSQAGPEKNSIYSQRPNQVGILKSGRRSLDHRLRNRVREEDDGYHAAFHARRGHGVGDFVGADGDHDAAEGLQVERDDGQPGGLNFEYKRVSLAKTLKQ